MKRKARRVIWFFAIALVVCGIAYSYIKNVSTIYVQADVPVIKSNKDMDDIRNRADIKKQQEVIVQEAYYLQQKDKVTGEKEASIQDFDNQLSDIEKQLEDVRAQKLSFQ